MKGQILSQNNKLKTLCKINLTHFFDQLLDEKTYGHVMQDYAVVDTAHDYINALHTFFGEYVLQSKVVAF